MVMLEVAILMEEEWSCYLNGRENGHSSEVANLTEEE